MQTHPTLEPRTTATSSAKQPTRRVTDAPTRMFHWLFATTFTGAYLTAESEHWRAMHVTLGYMFAGLLVFRLLYSMWGPRQASLAMLWRKLSAAPAWLRSLSEFATPSAATTVVNWRQGQNLALALAIVLMLGLVAPLTLSGYATYNDWGDLWGGDWLEEVHAFFGDALLAIVLLHLALIAGLSLLRRSNLALPMLTGRTPGKGPNVIEKNRVALAWVLLLAVLAFGAWQWQETPAGLIPAGGLSATNLLQDEDDD